MYPGETIDLQTAKNTPITISNSPLIQVLDLGTQMKVTAKQKGMVQIKQGQHITQIHIAPKELARPCQKLNDFTQSFIRLNVIPKSKHCSLQGTLLRIFDWQQITLYAQKHQIPYQFQAQIHSSIQSKVQKHLQNLFIFKNLPLPRIQLSPFPSLQIGQEHQSLKEDYDRILWPYGLTLKLSSAIVALKPLVRVKVIVVELNKNSQHHFGFEWTNNLTAQLLPSSKSAGELLMQLRTLQTHGSARILASPTLLSRSGTKAQFFAGGEIPIKTSSYYNANVTWKKYGIELNIEPIADFNGNMSIKIHSQVSSLNEATMINNIPGIKSHSIQSHFDMRGNNTIALSGLIKANRGRTTNALPGLSQLPIIGPLFQSKKFLKQQSELVIFVQPQLLNANNINEPYKPPQMRDSGEYFRTQ